MHTRLQFLATLGYTAVAGALPARALGAGANTMLVVNSRPYDYATPLDELAPTLYTANRTFFIRSHMGPPTSVDVRAWRLVVDGLVARPLQLSLDDLRKMEKAEIPAVLQCSGNGRYFFGEAFATVSHPAGAQWTYGGVGNARWGGVRVRDVLARAGVRPGARYATNSGLDGPLLPTTPKFARGIELAKLLDPETILAYEMNGEPLPYEHGSPVRLIVPGWAADHSVKWIARMTIAQKVTTNFWTSSAYRYPNRLGPPGKSVPPQDEHPVTALNVKSLITASTASRGPATVLRSRASRSRSTADGRGATPSSARAPAATRGARSRTVGRPLRERRASSLARMTIAARSSRGSRRGIPAATCGTRSSASTWRWPVRNALAVTLLPLVIATLADCAATHSAVKTAAAVQTTPAAQATPLVVGGATLPAGPELAALDNSCRACHSLGLVTQQRLSAATWKAEIDKMRQFGAPLPAANEAAVVGYLAAHLGPRIPLVAPHAAVDAPPITYTSSSK